ncbi:hypothetical protein BST95_09235 [Halioglobus japonicus]|uniref:Uncharacterized protein n=1 Tax=Halioglobus japonicus TaxID=930805 RepID=A0AAP8MEK8_9GAMM|nr:hypothetical protein [Halioglobus japonicus]AQA18392.1 hypothetical protein BST95_09235 [Halioglobus japonicus]PLW86408.1 hypothetical protein C0029_08275 [Halioglobus japonicus]GHD13028.1 hypothetical protein GCM10007052_14710 [Halioglobus japonicus]
MKKTLLIAALLASTSSATAEEATSLQSDWLEFVTGHKGDTLGVELMSIEPGGAEGMQKVTLAVPKDVVDDPDSIEEVVVVGRKPDEPEPIELPVQIEYEWLRDYDNDNYGLVIHIGEGNWPIRLFMNSAPGYTRQ